MIIWINGAFGAGKTTAAFELHRRLSGSFVYDPENVGFFIRKNAPECFSRGDFQDIRLWREMNYSMLKMLSAKHDGAIICPMTLVNRQYFDEIIGRLRGDGARVDHYILYANRQTLLKRLRFRSAGWLGRESFAVRSIERCLAAFETDVTEGKIDTDRLTAEQTAEIIAQRSGLELEREMRGRFARKIGRFAVLLRHIRR